MRKIAPKGVADAATAMRADEPLARRRMRGDHRKPLQAGTQENIIPDDATLELNVRSHAEPAA